MIRRDLSGVRCAATGAKRGIQMSEASGDEMQAFAVDDASRRRHRRWFVDFKSTFTLGENVLNCAVFDLSPGGACKASQMRPRPSAPW